MKQGMDSGRRPSSPYYYHHVTCISLASFVCYINAFYCDFVFDDNSAIVKNKDLKPHTPLINLLRNDFWGTPINTERSHKSYRPLTVLTFRFNYALNGLDPFGYHVLNVLLHLIVCVLYHRLCLKFLTGKSAFLAALLFAVHPIHTEAVTSIVGRAEILSAIFFLLSFLAYLKSTREDYDSTKMLVPCLILAAIAMFSKEQGITVLPLCILCDLFVVQKVKVDWSTLRKSSLSKALVLTMCLLILCYLRVFVTDFTLPAFDSFDNPASVSSTPSRQLTYAYLAAKSFQMILFPSNLCCDWTMGSIPLLNNLLDIRNLMTCATFYLLWKLTKTSNVLSRYKRTNAVTLLMALFQARLQFETKHSHLAILIPPTMWICSSIHETFVASLRICYFGILLIVLPYLPASNLLFPVGFVIAERILYIPSMGFCLLVAHGFSILQSRHGDKTRLLTGGLFILLISHACKTIRRNSDWKNEFSLYSSGLEINPNNAKLLNNVGHVFEDSKDYQQAISYYMRSIRTHPKDVVGYINVGRIYSSLNMLKEAEETLVKGKLLLSWKKRRIPINHFKIFITLANVISQNVSRLEEANQLYIEVAELRPDYVEAYINRGDILIKLNRTNEAKEVYRSALKYNTNCADLYYNLAVISAQENDVLQALDYLSEALEDDPDHEPSLLNSALLVQEHQVSEETLTAYHRLLRLLQSGDRYDEKVYFNLGMLSLTAGSSWNAEYWLRKAIQVKEDFKSALFNLALLLADESRPLEAVTFINQLLKFHPNHTKALILMGDIYVNNMKDLESAEQVYQRILEIDPHEIQGLHNLCVIHYKRQELVKAEKCLLEVAKIAPHKDYIKRHLKMVRNELESISTGDVLKDQISAFGYSSR